jgi:hypothetical protein
MKILSWSTYALSALAAAAISAGCSAANDFTQRGITPAGARERLDAFAGVGPLGALHPDRRKSWISPDAKGKRQLLFASDSGLGEIDIYSLPNMKLKGQLTGFNVPQGMCSDKHGNVYVAQTNATEVDEYSHAGSLVARYPDNYGLPIGCAVDPATGNLAVTDIVNDGSGPGQVQIFSNPSSQPKILTNPSEYFYYFVGYGPHSSLWVSGTNASGFYMLSQCGASSCTTINLKGGTLYFPGAVEWDNSRSTWVAFDQLCNNTPSACSYPVSARGVLGSPTTYKNYQGGSDCDLIQGAIVDRDEHVVGSDYEYCGAASSTFDRWGYPSGRKPTNDATLPSSNSVPNGIAISTK